MQEQDDVINIGCESIQLDIASDIVAEFSEIQANGDFQKETGGILIGYYQSFCNRLLITDMTHPQREDLMERFRFIRRSTGHQEIMDELWESSGYRKSYLGEWHTHNEKVPKPSTVDINNWKKISQRIHNFDELFFVIVGTSHIGFWTVRNASVIEIGRMKIIMR